MAAGSGSPCGACKFLRRKCAPGCIFAPYFCSEQGPARFAAIHKVFGASNVSKLLLHLPVHERCEAVVTITYEAQARIRDPVYGCVAHIFALQQQVAYLQAQLMQAKAQVANINGNNMGNHQWSEASLLDHNNNNNSSIQPLFHSQSCLITTTTMSTTPIQNYINTSISPQSSLDSIDQQQSNNNNHDDHFGGVIHAKNEGITGKKRTLYDMGELEELAFRMMRN
ncbi:hypothetical protein RND81_07G018700 [Saponaria officinalis]|uniref:LOB domain-containing protein n=1 Tax=Saponaria officinalis TaxID=3572 RepID=A0AAW1JMS6_SAPOF